MNILLVSMGEIGDGICCGGQIRSNFILDAIRSANKDGNIYILTGVESNVKSDGNVHVRCFDNQVYDYATITRIFRKFCKCLAGIVFCLKV